MRVCAKDGVPVGESRTGRLVHLDQLPDGVDPEHEVDSVEQEAWLASVVKRSDVRMLAAALMRHHADFHADPQCPFVKQLDAALRSPVG